MPVTRAQKVQMLDELIKVFQDGKSVFFSDYRGIPVKAIQKIRRELRAQNVHYGVSKKTLIRLAAKQIGYDNIPEEVLEGPVAVTVAKDDPLVGAKILQKLTKDYPQLRLLGGLFDKKVLNAAQAKQYALLPGREELLTKLVYLFKSPIQGFHGVLSNVASSFVRVVDAYRAKKEQNDGGAPAAADAASSSVAPAAASGLAAA